MPRKSPAIIRPFNMDDARMLVPDHVVAMVDGIIAIDDLPAVDFGDDALRLGFFTYCFCSSGTAQFHLNSKELTISANQLLIGIGDQVFRKISSSDDFHARMILVSHECVFDGIAGLFQLWPFMLQLFENPIIPLTPMESEWATSGFDYIVKRLRRPDNHYQRETTTALVRLFYFDVCDLLSHHFPRTESLRAGSYTLFDRFIMLLQQNYKRERSVTWYSQQLCITPKYLSEVVKNVSGKTAGQWITDFVLIEIKQLLFNTSLSIKQIAQQLNFANQSFLGKYFRNATGISPLEYRREHVF